jgi:hypothetical protein
LSKVERRGVRFQRISRDQPRTQLRQLSFRLIAKVSKKIFGNDQLQDRVAQKFQSLIIEMSLLGLMTETWMGQRFGEQKRIAKFVTDSFF